MSQIDEIKNYGKYIKYTPELSNNWSRSSVVKIETQKQRCFGNTRRLFDTTTSQLHSIKLWLINELNKLNLKFIKCLFNRRLVCSIYNTIIV